MYGNHTQEFFADAPNVIQPPTCPLEYVNVTKNNDTITVNAKARTAPSAEPPRVFTGSNKYQDYDKFWTTMSTNLVNFDKCIDPLKDDPLRGGASSIPDSVPAGTDLNLGTDDSSSDFGLNSGSDSDSNTIFDLPASPSFSFGGWSSINWGSVFKYILKISILFGLIFLFATVIPHDPLELVTRLLIAAVVVFCYIMLDVVRHILIEIKMYACSVACKC